MEFKTKSIIHSLPILLNKSIDKINKDDLVVIETLDIKGISEKKEPMPYYLEELHKFSNLKKIVFEHIYFSENDLDALNGLENLINIKFYKCYIENISILENKYTDLIFEECKFNSANHFMKFTNLVSLSIINPITDIEFCTEELSELTNLSVLKLWNVNIKDYYFLKKLTSLKTLIVNNFNLVNLNYNTNIKKIYLDTQSYNNQRYLLSLYPEKIIKNVDSLNLIIAPYE